MPESIEVKNKMLLSVEIKDGRFHYHYEVGSSSQTGSTPLSADDLVKFTSLLRTACASDDHQFEKRKNAIFKEAIIREYLQEQAEKEKP